DGDRAARERSHPLRNVGGIPPADLDVPGIDVERVGCDLRKCRLVALAVRRRARTTDDTSVRLERDGGALPAGTDTFDVERDTNTDEPARLLVFPRGRNVRELERAIERTLVIARVVGEAERGSVRERACRHEVAAAKLDRVEAELVGSTVDEALD